MRRNRLSLGLGPDLGPPLVVAAGFVAPAAPTWIGIGSLATANSASPLVVSYTGAGTPAADDIGVIVVAADSPTAYAAPSGYTEFTNSPQAATNGLPRIHAFWKRLTGGAEADVTIADVASDTQKVGVAFIVRGCINSGNPFNVSTGGVLNAASTAVAFPDATTTKDNQLVVNLLAHGIDAGTGQSSGETNTNLTSLTERIDLDNTITNGQGIVGISGVKATAGAVGQTACTLASSETQAMLTIAFTPY